MINGPLNSRAIEDWDENEPEEKLRKALILHEVLRDMTWLSGRVLGAISPRLTAWESYNAIVSKIVEAAEPSNLLTARRLFGFKSPSPDLYISPSYIVAEGSLVAQYVANHQVKHQRNAYNELLVPARWVDKIIKDELRRFLNDRLHKIYFGLIRSGWTSLYDFKPRVRSSNVPSPISRATTSEDGFKNRLNMAIAAIRAFAPVCHVPLADKSSHTDPSILHLWVRRLFDIIHPVTGVFEEFTPVARGQPSYLGAQACVRQFLIETSSTDLSTFIIVNSLVTQLASHDPDVHSILHTASDVFPEGRLLEKHMISAFFDWEEVNGLTVVNFGLREILQSSEEPLDAAVLVHLVEAITCELLFHTRAAHSTSRNGFSGLILPYSWARLLSKRYAHSQTVRDTSSVEAFLEAVVMISDGLKYHDRHRWWVGKEMLSKKPSLVHIFHLRLYV
ncbi:hypothetical protein FRC10_011711 [Ceratobasidium sp. 414]|nr:hypothetical protein FRC10_011711 [Ceratobasidium sp. 414]